MMKLIHLMTLPSQQFCLRGTLFNMHNTLMKHALRLALVVTYRDLQRPLAPRLSNLPGRLMDQLR